MTSHESLEPLIRQAWDLASAEPGSSADLVDRVKVALAEFGESQSRPVLLGRIQVIEAKHCLEQRAYAQSKKLAADALTVLPPSDQRWVGRAQFIHAASQLRRGELREACEELERLVGRLRGRPLVIDLATALNNLAVAYRGLRRAPEALAAAFEAISLFEQVGDKGKRAGAFVNVGNIYSLVGDLRKSLKWFDRCHEAATEIGNERLACHALFSRCLVFQKLGLYAESVIGLEATLEKAERLNDSEMVRAILHLIGEAYRESGEGERANEAFQRELEHGKRHEVPDQIGSALIGLGRVTHDLECDPGRALELFLAAIELLPKETHSELLIGARFGAGRCHVNLGQYDLGTQELVEARRLALEVKNSVWLTETLDLLSRTYEEVGDHSRALGFLRECVETKDRIQAEQRALRVDELKMAQELRQANEERLEVQNAHDELEARYRKRTDELRTTVRELELTAEERQRLESERAELETQLRHAQRLEIAGRMSAGVAHDFNNALMVIRSYADVALETGDFGSETREALSTIRSTSDTAEQLTYQLLAFARRQALELKCIDLNELIRDSATMLIGLLGRSTALELVLTEQSCPIFADRSQMFQVLSNLAANAGDAMGGDGRFTIRTQLVGETVVLDVEDTGAGIPSAIQERIFEPFFTTKGERGSGLGLSTVHGIVHQLGGTIKSVSGVGEGTSFELRFPITRFDLAVSESHPRRTSFFVSGKPRILLAEEDPALRNLISLQLRKRDHFVTVVNNATEAVAELESGRRPVDLVISSVRLPHQSGLDLVRKIQRINRDIGVILVSGYPESREQFVGSDRLVGFLQKPFKMSDLVKLLESVRVPVV